MEDKLNKTLIKNLSGFINPKTKKPIHNPKKMKRLDKEEKEKNSDDSASAVTTMAPRNRPSGVDIWRPARPIHKEKDR